MGLYQGKPDGGDEVDARFERRFRAALVALTVLFAVACLALLLAGKLV